MIGLLGGTFDPVHYGHLRPALEVMQALGLSQLRFIPNRQPPHREPPWLDASQRRQLLELAVAEVPGFELDCRELEREGPSYMVDTLASLREDFPEESLCLVMGMDAFRGLERWHCWREIPHYCHLVVTTRPGYSWPDSGAMADPAAGFVQRRVEDAAQLHAADSGLILLQYVTQLDISASQIRALCQQGRDVRYLLPGSVRESLLEMF